MNVKSSRIVGETLICSCNKYNDISHIVENGTDDLRFPFETSGSVEDEVECEKCGKKHRVTLYLSVDVSIDHHELEEIYVVQYHDKNGEPIHPTVFEDAVLGSDFPNIEDGEYIFGDMVYVVEDGVFESRYSNAVDPNQMALEI